MSNYELTFLVEDPKTLKKLEEMLTSFSGKKLQEQAWGKRLLTFPINKNTSAEYYTWNIQIGRDKLNEFKTKLNYDNLLMRYLFLAQEDVEEQPKKKAVKKTTKKEKDDEKTEEEAE